MAIFYKTWKKFNEIQLTKNKISAGKGVIDKLSKKRSIKFILFFSW